MSCVALACYDVLDAIFEHLDGLEETWYDYDPTIHDSYAWHIREGFVEGRRTLASCARVCRSFFDPAVARLWRNVDDISRVSNLLRCAPSMLAEPLAEHLELGNGKLPTNLQLSPQLVRAMEYARRIRAVHGPRKLSRSHDETYFLPAWVPMRLLPQLRCMRLNLDVCPSTDMSKLASSSLHSLHVIVSATSPRRVSPADASLSVILSNAPSLRYLRVSAADGLKGRWVDSIDDLPKLETLDILECASKDMTPYTCLRPLSALRNLQHLKFHLPDSAPTVGVDAFPSLRTLTLDAAHAPFRTITTLLSTITSQVLESLTLLNCQCISASINSELHEMTDVLRSKFSASLRRLALDLHGTSHPLADTQPLIKTMEPLLQMHALVDVRITASFEVLAIAASSEDLRKMAEAWPHVTRLHLSYGGSLIPIGDFATTARRCPHLADLIVPGIDASTSKLEVCSESSAHGLRFLSLYDGGSRSMISDPRSLAKCLDASFPAVDWRCPRDGAESWQETIEELVQLRIARLQGSF